MACLINNRVNDFTTPQFSSIMCSYVPITSDGFRICFLSYELSVAARKAKKKKQNENFLASVELESTTSGFVA